MMTYKELNEKIAVLLGFKKYTIAVSDTSIGPNPPTRREEAWEYPHEYGYLQTATPMYNVPDFTGIINRYRIIRELVKYN